MRYPPFILVGIGLLFSLNIGFAQGLDLSGSWTGQLPQNNNVNWQMKVSMSQNGNAISGFTQYNHPTNNTYVIKRFTGSINGDQLQMQESQVVDGSGGSWCIITYNGTISTEQNTKTIKGTWEDTSRGGCSGTFEIMKAMVDLLPNSIKLDSGLVAHLPLNATMNDLTDNRNDGSLENGAVSAKTNNTVSDEAIQLDGANDYIKIKNDLSLVFVDAFSLSVWVYPQGPGSGGSSANPGGMIINKEGEYEIARSGEGEIIWSIANTDPGWSGWNTTGYFVPEQEWTHLIFTYDAKQGEVILYGNGKEVYRSVATGNIGDRNINLNDLWLGGRAISSIRQFFQGQFDEIRLYRRAINSQEAQALWMARKPYVLSINWVNLQSGQIINEGTQSFKVQLVNIGADTLDQYDIQWQVNDEISRSSRLNQKLLPGDTIIITLPKVNIQPGQVYRFETFPTRVNNNPLLDFQSDTSVVKPVYVNPNTEHFAYQFDGINDYVNISSVAEVMNNSTDLTLEAWINTSRVNGSGIIGANGNSSLNTNVCLLFFGLPNNTRDKRVHLFNTNPDPFISSQLELETDRFYHLAFTYSNNLGTLYIDGVEESSAIANLNFSADDLWSIGQEYDRSFSLTDFFNGQIDEVRIWNTARTPEQIREWMVKNDDIYNEPGLVALYHFGQNSHKEALDYAGQHHGTLVGGVALRESDAPIPDNDFNILANDLGITSIVSPKTSCNLTDGDISVDIVNYGSNPQDQFRVGYRVNDSTVFWENVTNTLQAGNRYTHVFERNEVWEVGNNSIDVFLQLATDENQDNDFILGYTFANQNTPGKPGNLKPNNGITDVQYPLDLSWSFIPQADNYQLKLWNKETADTVYNQSLTSIQKSFYRGFDYGTTYQWLVTANNECGKVPGDTQEFTIRELPDLRMVPVNLDPNRKFRAGQTESIEVSVINQGSGRTVPGQWNEHLFLSPDTRLDLYTAFGRIADTRLASPENIRSLEPGESYPQTITFTVPTDINERLFYLFGFTDGNNAVTEILEGEQNQFMELIELEPVPYADLIADNIEIINSRNTFAGDTVTVRWNIINQSTLAPTNSPSWTDVVYLSPTAAFDRSTAIRVGRKDYNDIALNEQDTVSQEVSFRLPRDMDDDTYYFFVETDINNQVYEFDQEENVSATSAEHVISRKQGPDLQVSADSIFIPEATFFSNNEQLEIEWRVRNEGFVPTEEQQWTDAVYISPNSTFNNQSILLAKVLRRGTIENDMSYGLSANITLPSNLPAGTYYLYVETDFNNDVLEFTGMSKSESMAEDNNITPYPSAITVKNPNLVTTMSLANGPYLSGALTIVIRTLENKGTGELVAANLRHDIVLSPSDDIDAPSVISLFRQQERNVRMDVGEKLIDSIQVLIPARTIPGNYWVHVRSYTSNGILETRTDDNADEVSLTIQEPKRPDLVLVDLVVSDTLDAGEPFAFQLTVKNDGDSVAAYSNWQDKLYLSSSGQLDTLTNTLLATIERSQSLDTTASYTLLENVVLPADLDSGTYYLHAVTNGNQQLIEAADSYENNFDTDTVFIRAYPDIDLLVTSGTLTSAEELSGGDSFSVNYTVTNQGEVPSISNRWTDALYASRDPGFEAYLDVKLGEFTYNGLLNNGTGYSAQIDAVLPRSLAGEYYLILVSDVGDTNNDVNRANNQYLLQVDAGNPGPVDVIYSPPPDLEITSWNLPKIMQSGDSVTIEWTVTNAGPGTTNKPFVDKLVLSSDNQYDRNDLELTSFIRGDSLPAGGSYPVSRRIFVPNLAIENQVILIKTDALNGIDEGDNEDNNTIAQGVRVIPQLPSDLITTEIQVDSSAELGENITLSWQTNNIGTFRAKGTLDEVVYLSLDSLLDINDVLISRTSKTISLPPDSALVNTITTTTSGLLPGKYHVLVLTDARDVFPETDELNNMSFSLRQINIEIPTLQLETEKTVTVPDQAFRFLQLPITSQHEGETLFIKLQGENAQSTHEVYVRYGELPNQAEYDFTSELPPSSNQQVTMPALDTGIYYIAIRSTGATNNSSQIIAEVQDMAIISVDQNTGGNGAPVTVKLTGTGFRQASTISLRSEPLNETITGQIVLFRDPSTLFVKFNIKDAPLGTYDVIMNREGQPDAMAKDSFEIVEPITSFTPRDSKVGETGSGGITCIVDGLEEYAGALDISFDFPSSIRRNRPFYFTVKYENRGNMDLEVPTFIFSVLEKGIPVALNAAGAKPAFNDFATSVTLTLLEKFGPKNILRPGAKSSVRVYSFSNTTKDYMRFKLGQ